MTRPRDHEALAESLREPTASDADMARLEADLVRAVRARRAAPATTPRWAWLGLGLAVAAAAALWVWRTPAAPRVAHEAPVVEPTPGAPSVGSRVALVRGADLIDAAGQLGHAVLAAPDGALHVDEGALDRAAVTLLRGEVRVAFHPEHRGAEHLAITTDVARVEVVGTEFVVTRGAQGTHVSVSEGVVRVVTLASGEVHEVRVGESLDVPVATVAAAPAIDRDVVPHARVESALALPTLSAATRAADEGDLAGLESIADRGARADRLSALLELEDRYHAAHDRAGELGVLERTLALDPHGDQGANALFRLARNHEEAHTASAADEYARYLGEFPSGSFAAQAAQRLCALDAARCP